MSYLCVLSACAYLLAGDQASDPRSQTLGQDRIGSDRFSLAIWRCADINADINTRAPPAPSPSRVCPCWPSTCKAVARLSRVEVPVGQEGALISSSYSSTSRSTRRDTIHTNSTTPAVWAAVMVKRRRAGNTKCNHRPFINLSQFSQSQKSDSGKSQCQKLVRAILLPLRVSSLSEIFI